MKLYLHIGTPKTGTTSIQRFLKTKRDELLANDIYLPDTLTFGKSNNHRKLPFMVTSIERRLGDFEQYVRQGLVDEEVMKAAKVEFRKIFEEEIDSNKSFGSCIITSEHASARLNDIEELNRLNQLLYGFFDEIEIIVYLRRQVDFAVSAYSTSIKTGQALKELKSLEVYNRKINYFDTLTNWKQAFPNAKFHVRLFDGKELVEGDVVKDFCRIVGFSPEEEYHDIPANESLDILGLELLRRVNDRLSWNAGDKVNPLRTTIDQFFVKHLSEGPRKKPTAEETEEFEKYFFESNEKVRQEYFPDRDVLFPKAKISPSVRSDFDERELEALANMLADIWVQRAELTIQNKKQTIENTKLLKELNLIKNRKPRLSFLARMKRSIRKRLP